MRLKDTYIEKLKAQLDEWSAQIDSLELTAQQVDTEVRASIQAHIDDLKAKRDEALQKLAELQDATEEAWEEVKKGSETVWETIKQTFEHAKAKFEKRD